MLEESADYFKLAFFLWGQFCTRTDIFLHYSGALTSTIKWGEGLVCVNGKV